MSQFSFLQSLIKQSFLSIFFLLISNGFINAQSTGVVDGYANVNNYGAATYTIPIKVPNGNNLIPDLSLQYNSQAGNGLLGMGFSLTGLSVIEYDTKDVFHDGVAEGIDISKNNPFILDGQRLMLKSGTYGAAGATYGTEIETFITVTSNGSYAGCTQCPQYFTVKTKSGVTMEYGNTADSRFMSTDATRPIYWRLNKMTDLNGNYITYTYTNTDGQPRIDEINYTGNTTAGVTPYNKIKFAYIARTDQNTKYFAGTGMVATPVNQKHVLDKITITTEGGVLVKTYQCSYQTNGRYTFLSSINENGSDATSLKTTTFTLGFYMGYVMSNTFSTTFNPHTDIPAISNADIIPGDFDGDGQQELFVAYHNGQTPKVYSSYKIFSPYYNSLISQGTITNTGTYNYRGFQAGDFDGNGKDDIIMYKSQANSSFSGITILYSNTGTTFGFTSQDYSFSQTNYKVEDEQIQGVDKYGYIGDFDGDGRSDLVSFQSSGNLFLHLIGKNQLNNVILQNSGNNNWITGQNLITVVDIDNDGKNEFMSLDDGQASVYKIFYNSGTLQYTSSDFYTSPNYYNNILKTGDFNGDGKSDFLGKENVTNVWKVGYSTGTSYDVKTFPFSTNINTIFGAITPEIFPSDYNGDGKDDILLYYSNHFVLFLSKGTDFIMNDWYGNSSYYPIMNIINGYGEYKRSNGILCFNTSNKLVEVNIGQNNPFINQIDNGNGKVTYMSMEGNGSMDRSAYYYIPGSSNIYPVQIKLSTSPYLGNIIIYQNNNVVSEKYFDYKNAKQHVTGRGFLGFEQIIENDYTTGYQNTKNFTLTGTPYYINLLTNTTVTNSANPISSITYTKPITALTAGRFKIQTTNVLSQNSLTGKLEEHSYQYDAYGNTTQHIEKINTNLEVTTVNTTYNSSGSTIPPQPATISISKVRTRTGSPTTTFSKTIANTVFDAKGQVKTSIEFNGTPKAITTNYTYNNFGDKLTKSVTASGQTRAESYTYSTNGRFLLTKDRTIQGVAQTETYTYDAKWAKPASYKDVTNLTTGYVYDGFGRLKTITPPSPKLATTYTYAYDVGTYSGSVFKITKTHTGKPTESIYFDALGRERAKTIGTFNGTKVYETTYDAKGNIAISKAPNASGAGSITTTYGYNAYNQLTSKNITGIGTTNYAPSTSAGDYIVATTPQSGKFNTTTYDATGKKIKVVDAGGTVNYNYNATDDILEILNGSNKVTECTYDIYGRQTGLKDKDINTAVTNQYDYDGWGNLILQIDTKNNKTEQTFDNWGRLLTQKLTDGTTAIATTTTNTYRTTAPGLNQLNTVTGFNGITETYGYDALNRPNSLTQNFESVNYITSYVYDNDDRITKITYPSGFAANYTYNTNGFLTTVKNTNNTKTLYSATGINAYDQVTNFKLGNNVVSTHTYNDYGMPTDYVTSGIQNLHMDYSNLATGNMTQRKDLLKTLTETFTYDNPTDRLLSMQLGTNAIKSTTYDGTGNILSKTDAGSEYIYGDANHIHAVTKIKSKVFNGPGLTDPLTEPCDISTEAQDITYTAFNQPNVLTEGTGTALVKQLSYFYAANHQRIKSIYKENGTVKTTRYYFGNYEKDITNGVTNEIHYVPTGVGLGCIMVKSASVENYYYPYKDHQGSILKVVNEAGTTTIAEQSFDAWGRPRNPANWTYANIPTTNPAWLYRGYTGHEMLSKFALINMNGRMYDYINGRMLSPDNLVHDDQGTQGLNRYSYVFNNPLKYIDPTGEDGYDDFEEQSQEYDNDDWRHPTDDEIRETWNAIGKQIGEDTWIYDPDTRSQSDFEQERDDSYEDAYLQENGDKDDEWKDKIEPKWYRPEFKTGTIEVDVPKEYLDQIAIIPENADKNSKAIILKENGTYEGDGLYFKMEKDKWYKVQGGDKIIVSLSVDKTQFLITINTGIATFRMPIGGDMTIIGEGPPFYADETGYHQGEHPISNNPF